MKSSKAANQQISASTNRQSPIPNRQSPVLLAMVAILLLACTSVALAVNGYDLSWWTVDGGGATFSTGGGYELGGTIGQPDAGVLSGGGYTLVGGFWGGGAPAPPGHKLYLPLIMKNRPAW
jgi:hypothetical protein